MVQKFADKTARTCLIVGGGALAQGLLRSELTSVVFHVGFHVAWMADFSLLCLFVGYVYE